MGFYLTSRGTANETYYAAQKAVRAMGTNTIDNAARICHSPSTFALKEAIGVGATTCSYTDWMRSDLIVFIGSNLANNQPVATKYLHHAKREGARVAVVNPYREPGMERYWIPSMPESALFGTKIADDFFQLNVGGDIAFLTGALQHLVENGLGGPRVRRRPHDRVRRSWRPGWQSAAGRSSRPRPGRLASEMHAFARLIGEAERGVLVWSMGVTQHEHGEDNVRAIVNLALARGWVGREGCGLMPIRGHSGVQGGAEMGCYATALPGRRCRSTRRTRRRSAEQWGFDVPGDAGPHRAGDDRRRRTRRARRAALASAATSWRCCPTPTTCARRWRAFRCACTTDIVLSEPDAGRPGRDRAAAARHHALRDPRRRHRDHHRAAGDLQPRGRAARGSSEARPEWEVLLELARRVAARPGGGAPLRGRHAADPRGDRRGRAALRGHREAARRRRQLPVRRRRGYPPGAEFPTADGKARFSAVAPPPPRPADGLFAVSTRRGKQFNSMVQERKDSITGAVRDAVLVSAADAERLGIADGDAVTAALARTAR